MQRGRKKYREREILSEDQLIQSRKEKGEREREGKREAERARD